jgi:hypothetical protein
MKQLSFLFAIIIAFAFTSCKKETVTPPPVPQPIATTYDGFKVVSSEVMDSVVITNTTTGLTEHITANVSSLVCSSVTYNLSEFPLTNQLSSGDVVTVTLYHSAWTWGNLPFTDFTSNSTTDNCEAFGGNSGRQTSSGNSTTFTFTSE